MAVQSEDPWRRGGGPDAGREAALLRGEVARLAAELDEARAEAGRWRGVARRLVLLLAKFVKDCGETRIQDGRQGAAAQFRCNGCGAYRTRDEAFTHGASCEVAQAAAALAACAAEGEGNADG